MKNELYFIIKNELVSIVFLFFFITLYSPDEKEPEFEIAFSLRPIHHSHFMLFYNNTINNPSIFTSYSYITDVIMSVNHEFVSVWWVMWQMENYEKKTVNIMFYLTINNINFTDTTIKWWRYLKRIRGTWEEKGNYCWNWHKKTKYNIIKDKWNKQSLSQVINKKHWQDFRTSQYIIKSDKTNSWQVVESIWKH